MLPALLVAAAVRPVMRREIRSLSETERENFFAAMHVMKRHTLTEGTALYGSHFRTHEYLLRKHASATVDKDCDQGHGGPGFLGFHFAITVAHPAASKPAPVPCCAPCAFHSRPPASTRPLHAHTAPVPCCAPCAFHSRTPASTRPLHAHSANLSCRYWPSSPASRACPTGTGSSISTPVRCSRPGCELAAPPLTHASFEQTARPLGTTSSSTARFGSTLAPTTVTLTRATPLRAGSSKTGPSRRWKASSFGSRPFSLKTRRCSRRRTCPITTISS